MLDNSLPKVKRFKKSSSSKIHPAYNIFMFDNLAGIFSLFHILPYRKKTRLENFYNAKYLDTESTPAFSNRLFIYRPLVGFGTHSALDFWSSFIRNRGALCAPHPHTVITSTVPPPQKIQCLGKSTNQQRSISQRQTPLIRLLLHVNFIRGFILH
jgi:hypothetical protein